MVAGDDEVVVVSVVVVVGGVVLVGVDSIPMTWKGRMKEKERDVCCQVAGEEDLMITRSWG